MSDAWYKRDIRKAIKGMTRLTLEERGAYNTLIDHQYLMGGPLPDDETYVAGIMGCDVRVWRRLRRQLLDKERIVISGGAIEDLRASYELASRQAQRSKRVASGQLGGIASGQSRKNKDVGEAGASHTSNQIRGDKIREEPPLPPKGGDLEREFNEVFWSAYPRKQAKKPALKAFLKARKAVPLATIMAGVKRYAEAMAGRAEYVAHAASWLNAERWNDEEIPQSSVPGWRQNGTGGWVRAGSKEFEAHKQHALTNDPRKHWEFVAAEKSGGEVKVSSRWPNRNP